MQAKTQMFLGRNGRISVALCVILFTGYTVQGGPVQLCRHGDSSPNCVEQQGPPSVNSDGAANMVHPPKTDRMLMKKLQFHPDTAAFSGDEYGSGNEIESDLGSGIEDDVDDHSFSVHQPDRDLNLKLTDEGLFPQKPLL